MTRIKVNHDNHEGYAFAQSINKQITARLLEVPITNHFYWRAALRTISTTCMELQRVIKQQIAEKDLQDQIRMSDWIKLDVDLSVLTKSELSGLYKAVLEGEQRDVVYAVMQSKDQSETTKFFLDHQEAWLCNLL